MIDAFKISYPYKHRGEPWLHRVLAHWKLCFPDLKADYILANPPFNMKRWGGEHLREDKRWKYGVPLAFVMYRPFWKKD